MKVYESQKVKNLVNEVFDEAENYGWYKAMAHLQRRMTDIPEIDAEPVVRCKDCKFNYANQIPSGDECQLCVELPISKDFFCAYGEKMDEEEIK